MRITIENTSKIVRLVVGTAEVPARIWQGETEDGIPVQCFITLIAPEVPETDPAIDAKTAAFEEQLKRVASPRPTVAAIDARMIL